MLARPRRPSAGAVASRGRCGEVLSALLMSLSIHTELPELPIAPGASPPHADGGASTAPGAGLSPGALAKSAAASAVAHPVAASTLAALVITLGAVAHHAIQGAPKSEAASASPAVLPAPALHRSDELEPPRRVPSSGEDTSPTVPGPNASPAQSEPLSTPLRHPAARPRPAPPATPPPAAEATEVTTQMPPPPDHLGEQLTLLARARQHLRTGQPHAALTVLTSFEQQFPEGALLPEVTVLRRRAERQLAEKALPSGERPTD